MIRCDEQVLDLYASSVILLKARDHLWVVKSDFCAVAAQLQHKFLHRMELPCGMELGGISRGFYSKTFQKEMTIGRRSRFVYGRACVL